MNTIELFSGTKSFSKVMARRGHKTFTVDNDSSLEPDFTIDLSDADMWDFPDSAKKVGADILWASPPCTAFSVASIGTHWGGGYRAYEPKTPSARQGIRIVKNLINLIDLLEPKWWFIENPRGVLRKMPFMEKFLKSAGGVRHTVWYCRYGDKRAKPTDIWTNATWWTPRRACKNGGDDHEPAPRGSKTGTQGIDGAKDRGRIPAALFEEILSQIPR